MTFPFRRHQDPLEIRVAIKSEPEHVIDFPLIPVGVGPDLGRCRNRGRSISKRHLDPHITGRLIGEQVIDHAVIVIGALLARPFIDGGNIFEPGIADPVAILEEPKQIGQIVQMVLVELSVIFFEVMFLYREMIDALTPWIAQQTNERLLLGLWSTLILAAFGWVGVRGMTWFLFGRFGTPALLAILGRETVRQETPMAAPVTQSASTMHSPIAVLKAEAAWFHEEARRVFELLSLPVLQLRSELLHQLALQNTQYEAWLPGCCCPRKMQA